MNERHRQAYLKVMEIQPFYLRRVLPHAKGAPAYDYPELSSKPAISGIEMQEDQTRTAAARAISGIERGKSSPRPSNANVRAKKLLDLKADLNRPTQPAKPDPTPNEAVRKQPQSDRAPVRAEVETQTTADSEHSGSDIAFKLRFLHINSTLAVIDELPFAEDGGFLPATNALLQAILLALGVNWDSIESRSESFTWPIDAALDFEGDQKAAAEAMLKGFIAQHYAANRFANLLVFGGQLESLLAKTGDLQPEHDFKDEAGGYYVTLTSTLSAMISYPALKKQVWNALQALRSRLSSSL
ncbi:MAG: hypothetical protein AB8B95_02180 [Pseudohongiellaceae bacterium]